MLSELIARKAEMFEALLDEGVPLFPGVAEAVRSLATAYPIGIASSALREEIETILTSHGLADAFVDIVGAADVAQTKPHPKPYWTALERINEARQPTRPIEPSECVVFEDTVGGITGAKAAGMLAVAVTNSYPADQLADADYVLSTLEGMSPAVLEALVAEGKSE
jgi:HAD superfamily hydrolase (TIGR01509 family)